MRTPILLLPALLLLGCKPEFTELGEACHDKIPGSGSIEAEEAVALVQRANCYRRLAGLYRGSLHKKVQEAAENHLEYLALHKPWENGKSFTQEEPGKPGYTGADIFERMDYLNFQFGDITGWGVWEWVWLPDDLPDDRLLDFYMPDPVWRQVFLQPDWRNAGYARAMDDTGVDLAYGTVFYAFPTSERENAPIVYPRDGQVDVPWSYRSTNPGDTFFALGEVGFPITATFSDSTVLKFDPGQANPYDIQLRTAELRGPDGPIELDIVLPPGERVGGVLRYTLIAVPLDPLAPDTSYTFEAEVSWGDARKKTLQTTFRTAKTPDFRTTYLDQLEDVTRAPQGLVLRGPSGSLR